MDSPMPRPEGPISVTAERQPPAQAAPAADMGVLITSRDGVYMAQIVGADGPMGDGMPFRSVEEIVPFLADTLAPPTPRGPHMSPGAVESAPRRPMPRPAGPPPSGPGMPRNTY